MRQSREMTADERMDQRALEQRESGERSAVVVGVSRYKDPSLNLQYADRDAQEFYNFIRSPDGGEFAEANLELLINEDATVAAVNRAFRSFLKKPGRDDLVVIYLACHGTPDPDRPENVFLMTHDIDAEDVTSGVPIDEVHRAVKNTLAERVVILPTRATAHRSERREREPLATPRLSTVTFST